MSNRTEAVYLRGLADLMLFTEQNKVAAALGVSESTISYIRTCKRGASLGLAVNLAKFYRVSIEELINDKSTAATSAQPKRETSRAR